MKYDEIFRLKVPPLINQFELGTEPINAGDMISIYCTVSKGDLPLNISWFFNGQLISKKESILRSSQRISIMSIEDVQYRHAGLYTCQVSNLAATSNMSTQLRINGT